MKLKKLRVKNFKCFLDSETLEVADGFTCVLGANDAGKSAFAQCVGGPPTSVQFQSLEHAPAGESLVEAELLVEPGDYERLAYHELWLPIPAGLDPVLDGTRQVKQWFREGRRLSAAFAHSSTVAAFPELQPAVGDNRSIRLELRDGLLRYDGGATANTAPQNTIPSLLAASFKSRAFVFHAERPVVGRGPLSGQSALLPNASNLPQALNRLQTSNEPKFAQLQQHVKEVFPHLEGLDARTEGAEAEVWMWPVSKSTDRPDLAIRLVDSGTGVGQTLGILAVVVSAPPSTIVIDEPQSFLHPAAIRRLFGVLKRYPKHQYIVITHSPAVITAAEPKAIGLVRRTPTAGSRVVNVAETSQSALRELLVEVGAGFADVFGVDRVLWVEGPTEVEAFRHILRARLDEIPQGLEILPVRSVDELGGRDVERILDVYRLLLAHSATLLPPAHFVFDGEHRHRLEKRGGQWCRCLPVHNFETFLLDIDSIVEWLHQKRECLDGPIDRAAVAAWLAKRDAGDDTDGAKVLRELLRELSKAKCEFKKPDDSVRLTEIVLRRAPARFDRLVELLRPIIRPE